MTPTTFYRGTRNNHWIFMVIFNVYQQKTRLVEVDFCFSPCLGKWCVWKYDHIRDKRKGVMVVDGILAWLYITFGKLDCIICLIIYTCLKVVLVSMLFFPKICFNKIDLFHPRKCFSLCDVSSPLRQMKPLKPWSDCSFVPLRFQSTLW